MPTLPESIRVHNPENRRYAQEAASCPEEEVHAGSRPPVITVAISDRTMREDFFIIYKSWKILPQSNTELNLY